MAFTNPNECRDSLIGEAQLASSDASARKLFGVLRGHELLDPTHVNPRLLARRFYLTIKDYNKF